MNVNHLFLIFLSVFSISSCAQDKVPDKEMQIAVAVLAAPAEDRDQATVYGYDTDGELVLLKEGSNSLICVADDPNRERFQCVCYHKDLQPFMDRGRMLRAEGKTNDEIFAMREDESKAGTLKMPEQPTTLHLLEGADAVYNKETGEMDNANYRYVVYIPWATAATTGLPLKPMVPGGPWIMDPGTHRAHIMITPPPEN